MNFYPSKNFKLSTKQNNPKQGRKKGRGGNLPKKNKNKKFNPKVHLNPLEGDVQAVCLPVMCRGKLLYILEKMIKKSIVLNSSNKTNISKQDSKKYVR